MKTSAIILGISAFAATAAAQGITVPSCLQPCLQDVFTASGCASGDTKCVCTGSGKGGGAPTIGRSGSCATSEKSCSVDDLKAWGTAWSNACKPYAGAIAATVANNAPSAIAAASTVIAAASTALALAEGTQTTLATSATATDASASSAAGGNASGASGTNPANPTKTNAAASLKFESAGVLAAAAALYFVV